MPITTIRINSGKTVQTNEQLAQERENNLTLVTSDKCTFKLKDYAAIESLFDKFEDIQFLYTNFYIPLGGVNQTFILPSYEPNFIVKYGLVVNVPIFLRSNLTLKINEHVQDMQLYAILKICCSNLVGYHLASSAFELSGMPINKKDLQFV